MPHSLSFLNKLRRLSRDGAGNVAMMFGLMAVPLVLMTGVGIDFANALSFKTQLQSAVDDAALAGASAYTSSTTGASAQTIATNFMNKAVAGLPANNGVSFTVTPATTASGGNTTAYTVDITASATVNNSFMALGGIDKTSVNVSATAENPVTTATVNLNGFSSNACDGNTIYWYLIPSTATVSTYVPPNTALTTLWSNTTTVTPASFTLTSSSQRIGFALKNVTGAKCTYGSNGFGGAQGSTHMFYSNLFPPSKQAYPSVTTNHSLQVAPLPSGGTLANVISSLPQTTFTSDPNFAAPTCGEINGQTYVYAWNDMGGTSDDLDYNDAAYTFSCSGANGSSGFGASGVVLVK